MGGRIAARGTTVPAMARKRGRKDRGWNAMDQQSDREATAMEALGRARRRESGERLPLRPRAEGPSAAKHDDPAAWPSPTTEWLALIERSRRIRIALIPEHGEPYGFVVGPRRLSCDELWLEFDGGSIMSAAPTVTRMRSSRPPIFVCYPRTPPKKCDRPKRRSRGRSSPSVFLRPSGDSKKDGSWSSTKHSKR
jgi:hypothetical protein